MNLLKVQDALKNASDQQLMALMQAPDSTAPSYLVLSEIRRRKDMRSKQAAEGASNRTVAEDLTAPQEPVGIQGLQGQDSMDPDGVDAADGGVQGMAAGGLASLRRYREGGVVRMQAGGAARRPLSEMSDEELMALQRGTRAPLDSSPQGFSRLGISPSLARSGAASQGYAPDEIQAELLRRTPPPAFVAIQPPAPTSSIQPEPGFVSSPSGTFADPGAAFGNEPMPATTTQADGQQPPTPAATTTTPTTPVTQGQGQPARPATTRTEQPAPVTPGLDGLRNAPAALPEGGQLPTMAELMRQNAALFPDGMGSIRDRMREERVDPAARRNEAVNMALIEAGLRIAGSRNPSLIGAIGEGALPAVQSYGQQLGQIRGEQREARRDELELAKQETNRQFAIGQISAAEYRSRMDNINANIRVNAQERGANARLIASEAAATRRAADAAAAAEASDLRRGYASPERLARMTPEERAAFERIRTIGRPLDTSGVQGAYNATVQQIDRIRASIEADPRPAASSRGFAEWQQRDTERRERLRQAENQLREYRDILVTGRSPGGAGGTASGTTNLPSGARIENGRYIPAGS